MDLLKKIIDFYKNLWNLRLHRFSKTKSFFIHQFRIFVLAFRGFIEDKIQLRASALTFYSLLSIVPVLAMGFAVAKGFGYDEKLKNQLLDNFSGQETVMNQVISFAENLLNNTKEGYLAGVGAIVLIWTAMKVLGHIERSFNDIWQIKKDRNIYRKFSDYVSFMIIAPSLLIASSSYSVIIANKLAHIEYINWFSVFISKLTPLVILWVLFSFLYIVMPNTKVNYRNGMIAGIIGGTLFYILQTLYIKIQIGLFSEKYNAIYGAFATLPLFLVWMQYSWFIVLFGAEISFAYQNVENYEYEAESQKISTFYKRVLTFFVLHSIVQSFDKGEEPLTSRQISKKLDMPIRLVREILFLLKNSQLVTETITSSPKEMAFQPALDINKIDIKYIQEKLEMQGVNNLEIEDTPVLKKIYEIQANLIANIKKSPQNALLKDL